MSRAAEALEQIERGGPLHVRPPATMLSGMLHALERIVDSVKARLRRRYGINRLQILAYAGYRNATRAYVRGRVLVGKHVELGSHDHGALRNFQNMSRRFLSAEIPHAALTVIWEGNQRDIETDEEGFFDEELPLQSREPVPVMVRSRYPGMTHPVEVRLEVFDEGMRSRLVVVSDIDDTVLLTMANRAIRMVMLTLFSNAHTRLAFSDVDQWYRELRAGAGGREQNPFFYVSSSPWNLYDFLEEFLDVNGIPAGPMFLRNHGINKGRTHVSDHRGHKIRTIEKLLTVYPGKPFLLIGDTGQKDPEIYRELVGRFPGRFAGVLLRNVSQLLPMRVSEVQRFGREIEALGCRFKLFDNTRLGIKVSREWGLIGPDDPSAREVREVRGASGDEKDRAAEGAGPGE